MLASDAIVHLEGVSKRFGGLAAVKDVSISVARGEICGVIGPNGAGKSTLFNLISGSMPVSSGRVLFEGRDVTSLPLHQRARIGIARTFQLAHTFESLSVEENVLVGAEQHAKLDLLSAMLHVGSFQKRTEQARRQAAEAMDLVGVADIADLEGSQLTFGQQRLVATARALASSPRLLLLDEPAAGLSSGDMEQLAQAILRAQASGATVIVVEHNVDLIMRLCQHVVVMHLGEKIADGSPIEVRESERVLEAYLGT